jgi:uncharacterized protein YeaO (DUF488 family)
LRIICGLAAPNRELAPFDLWLKEIAPSDAQCLRFDGDPRSWQEFKSAYYAELQDKSDNQTQI